MNSKLIECAILSGGRSERMGTDKGALLIDGEPMGVRIARSLTEHGYGVTVLGNIPSADFPQLPDADPFSGPLVAISDFQPVREWVFVCSCDIPLFDARLVEALFDGIDDYDAAIPSIDGRLQPLCALYTTRSVKIAHDLAVEGERRVMAWVQRLRFLEVNESTLAKYGLDPRCVLGANTPEELEALLRKQ